jgi:GNAT superfamily N-acetyltransferase
MMKRIQPDQRDAAVATLVEAFFHDPLMQIVQPDETKRAAVSGWFLGGVVDVGLRWGEVWGNDDASAVAMWLPPDVELGMSKMVRVGIWRLPLKVGLRGVGRVMGVMSASEPFHKLVGGPHWYLMTVGTRRDRQGQGLGSALVEVGTSQADAGHLPCYLETGTDSNIAFYTKRGFEVAGRTEYGGHTITGMIRPAR